MSKHSNHPTFFYNFVGPESDSTYYTSSSPNPSKPVVREVNLLGAMERVWPEFPDAQARRRIAVMRRDRQRYDVPNMVQLRRPVDRDATFVIPPPPTTETMIAFGQRGRGVSIRGGAPEQRDAAAASRLAAMGELDHVGDTIHGGSSSTNPNPNKKMKQVCVEPEKLTFPKPMYARGAGSGSGDAVLVKGYISTGSDERVRIVCMCHNQAYTPEEFVAHSGGRARGGVGDPPCFVTVTRGDSSSCIHAR